MALAPSIAKALLYEVWRLKMRWTQLGSYGEKLAVDYVRGIKYDVLSRNYRCNLGEIDIIAMDAKTLVFIEVKTRSSLRYGSGLESVNYKKQRRIRKVATSYLNKNRVTFSQIRFDVIDILVKKDAPIQIDHIKNAF